MNAVQKGVLTCEIIALIAGAAVLGFVSGKPARPPKIQDQLVKHTYKTNIVSSPIELLSAEERTAMQQTMKVDLNTAGEAEIDGIPGVGPSMAKAIVAYREANGPFKSFADIDNISGTGAKFMEKLPGYARLSGVENPGGVAASNSVSTSAATTPAENPAPEASASGAIHIVNINKASAKELEDLPGVGASMAAAIVQYRTEHGPFKSVDELDNVSGIGPAKLEKMRSAAKVQ